MYDSGVNTGDVMRPKDRFEVFKRDGFACQYCGKKPTEVVLEVDHIDPKSKGGADHIDNWITACFECNRGKADNKLTSLPATIKHKKELLIERQKQVRAYNELLEEIEVLKQSDVEEIGNYFYAGFGRGGYIFAGDWERSIKWFLQKLPKQRIKDAIDIALLRFPYRSDKEWIVFKYMCGVLHRMRKEENNG